MLLDSILSPSSLLCHGSLPFTDPAEAVSFVLSHPCIIPFWPELPRRHRDEEMLRRAERVRSPGWSGYASNEAAGLFELRRVIDLRGEPLAVVKGQLAGPLTRFLFGEPQADLETCLDDCARELRWQIGQLAAVSRTVVIVLDDPALERWDTIPVDIRVQYAESISYLLVTAAEQNAHLGIHSCTALVPELLKIPMELYSFDLTGASIGSLGELRAEWGGAVESGLILIPGLYPATTGTAADIERGDEMHRSFVSLLEEVARPGSKIRTLKSATCGHAGADPAWLETLYAP